MKLTSDTFEKFSSKKKQKYSEHPDKEARLKEREKQRKQKSKTRNYTSEQ